MNTSQAFSSIADLFAAHAFRIPEAIAVRCAQEQLTYSELNESAGQLAGMLRSLGAQRGTLIAICVERSIHLVIGLLGTLKTGAAYVPLDPEYPKERLAYMIADSAAPILLTQSWLADKLPRHEAFTLLMDHDRPQQPGRTPDSQLQLTADDLAYMIYTSGSTGKPKGAMNTHGGILNRLLWMQEAYRLTREDRVLQKTPFSFDVSVWEFFWPLISGAQLILAEPGGHQDPRYLVKTIQKEKITTIHFVPSMLRAFLEEPGIERCSSLRRVICSGEALSLQLKEKFFEKFECELHNLYGPTEAAVDVTAWQCRKQDGYKVVPIGRPISNTQIHVLDEEMEPCKSEETGEVYIGGAGLARGYWRRPELTAEKFVANPLTTSPGQRLYRTGDLGRFLSGGILEFLGRSDSQIKIRGARIELGEVEAALLRHPQVKAVAVLALRDNNCDLRLTAYVVPDGPWKPTGLDTCQLPNGMVVAQQNKNETEYLYDEIFVRQAYLRHGITLAEDACVVDVGANIGLFSLFAAQYATRGKLYAFEPVPAVFEKLTRNLRQCGLSAKAFPVGIAAEDGEGEFIFYPRHSMLSGMTVYANRTEAIAILKQSLENQKRAGSESAQELSRHIDDILAGQMQTERCQAPLQSFSRVMRDQQIGHVDLLKIDVEGAELDVLMGIAKKDWPRISQVVVESHGSTERLQAITALLRGAGFLVEVEQEILLHSTTMYNVYARRPGPAADTNQENKPDLIKTDAVHALSVSDLQEFLKERLPSHMVPSAFVLLEKFPLTLNGKIDRQALPQPDSWVQRKAAYAPPRNDREQQMARTWESLLNVQQVGIQDHFFDIGGHSLIATRFLARLRQELKVEVPFKVFFSDPTIAGVSAYLEGAEELPAEDLPVRPAPKDGIDLPLSCSQERVWFLCRMDPNSLAYNFQSMLRLRGNLVVPLLEHSLSEIVRRHEIFRTTFHDLHGGPVQLIHDPYPVTVPVVDVSQSAEPEHEAKAVIAAELQKVFDLRRLPLIYWVLIRISPDQHLLLHKEHHLIHDGWSFNCFLNELCMLYRAGYYKAAPELPVLPVQFSDFAVWQRQWIHTREAARQLDYWRKKLSGAPELVALPWDHSRPPVQSYKGRQIRIELPVDLCKALRERSRKENVTLYMTMLAAFMVLVQRLSGQTDLCVGSGIANRRWEETHALIGMLVNNVVMRCDLSGNPKVSTLLQRVRETALQAYDNQDIPFDRVVGAIHPRRSLSHQPLYQLMFSFHDSPFYNLALPECEVELTEGLGNNSAKWDMNINVVPRAEQSVGVRERNDEGISLLWEYSTALFDHDTIEHWTLAYISLLAAMAADSTQHIDDLPLLSAKQESTLAAESVVPVWTAEATIHSKFEQVCQQAPKAIAVTYREKSITYEELNFQANQLAHQLVRLGVGPEVRVGICMERSLEMVTGILGVLKTGGAYVPIDPSHPSERLAYILEDAKISVLLTQQRLQTMLPRSRAQIIYLDTTEWISSEAPENFARVHADNVAYVIYTSGSTGMPKGVEVTHRNVLRLFAQTEKWFNFGTQDAWTLFHSYAFDFSVWELWGALLYGGRLVVVPAWIARSSEEFYDLLKNESVTVLNQTPSAFQQLMRTEESRSNSGTGAQLALRWVIFGGEALDFERLRPWLKRYPDQPQLVNMYGITETTIHVTWHSISLRDLEDRIVGSRIGIPIPDLKAYVLDSAGRPVPAGVPGELYIAGDGLSRGYLKRPELTAQRFVPHPFSCQPGDRLYRSGDLARCRADGTLEYLGRIDHQVKIRGYRIELGEIEATLNRHAAVKESAVTLVTEADDRRLIAYVVLQARGEFPIHQLQEYLQQHLPEYMVVHHFVFLEKLPMTSNGKLDRSALSSLSLDATCAVVQQIYVAPETEMQEMLARIWADVLHVERVGINDNFFDLGGHSLLGMQVIAQVRDTYGVNLPLRNIFEQGTVARLAEIVQNALFEKVAGLSEEEAQHLLEDSELPSRGA